MSAKPHVKRAESAVAPLRRQLSKLRMDVDPERAVDVAEIASVACDCELLFVSQLSEAKVFSILARDYGVDVGDAPSPTNYSLAGAFCMSTNGFFRWIFVREEDSDERKRFTIAHELGHFFLEAMGELEQAAAMLETHSSLTGAPAELKIFSRCSDTEPSDSSLSRATRNTRLTRADLSEIHAHHFAAEVLMPYQGVCRLVAREVGTHGVRNRAQLDQLVSLVAQTYSVSMAAARLRLEKDLAIVPLESGPNRDLFAD